ncbi:MAG: carbohydrate kinase [Candidatus Omnitrophica bacterium]|nr:carbohydrate kinase [Candidatus Omnitrophota bacterium]
MSFKIFGIGEVLWDLLPTGKQLGGAPANFAYHAQALGADARLISRVGNDSLGREILARLKSLGMAMDGIGIDDTSPTGTVSVDLSADGQPHFTIHENVAWDRLTADDNTRRALADADAVCFGSLAQRLEPARSSIRSLVSAAPPDSLRIFDINLRQQFYSKEVIRTSLEQANVLKLNHDELPVLGKLLGLDGDINRQLAELGDRYQLRLVVLTRGAGGSLLYARGRWSEQAGLHVEVKDTVGAGDAFTAAVAMGLLAGWDLDLINRRANELAAYVCSCPGATPALPAQLRWFAQGE